MNYRQTLINIYLDWINNYASIETFAEHNHLTWTEASELIELAKYVFENQHPDL